MDIESFRDYCLSLPEVEETTPFDEDTLVFKVRGKMFTLCSMGRFDGFSVKCDPDEALELRDRHPEITGAYHMNKRHWNSVRADGDLSGDFLREQILKSYLLVVKGLPKADRELVMAMFKK